jgi:predicted MPP superfamily phosphohydrolase
VLALLFRNLADIIILSIVLLMQWIGARWLLRQPVPRWGRWTILALTAVSFAAVTLAVAMRAYRVARYFPDWWLSWGRAGFICWSMLSVFLFFALAVSKVLPTPRPADRPGRRMFLNAARGALFAVPAAALGYGTFIERTNIRLREQNIPIPGLHPDLYGLRIVQLTDIHMSPFLTARQLDYAVNLANETRAHVALVTGDLITGRGDPVDACLNGIARLRADAGVLGCLGNHEIYAKIEDYVAARGARLGLRFLRSESAALKFGGASVNFAGVDYQPMHNPYLVGAERLIQPGAFNILLSHNPDVFPVAADMGYGLTIAGHTHGGQVRVEILREDLNIARFYTPFVDGLYRKGDASIFVSRGIGTIVLPMRLGAAPEVALMRLVPGGADSRLG